MGFWHDFLYILLGFVIGAIAGFFIARKVTSKFMKENPPINEDMIRALFNQMGRKPNQKQINQILNNVNKQINKK